MGDGPAFEHQVDVGDGRGASEWVARVGVTVEEGAVVLVGTEEGLEDRLGREGRGKRQVTPGQSLRDAQEVRFDALVLDGEHAAGAAEPGGDLVRDQVRAGVACTLGRA